MSTMRVKRPVVPIGVALLALAAVTAYAQQSMPPAPNVQALGPQVGTRVPGFTLPDQTGRPRELTSLMGRNGLMLVFYRSADWCPYCKTQLAELQTQFPELQRQGIGLAAISYDAVPVLSDFTHRRGITFPLLSDAGSAIIRKYGILNTTVPASNTQSFGIPFPGTFMLNRDGVVTARFFEQAYQERVTVGTILARLGTRAEVPLTVVDSPQLEVTTYLSDTVAAPGTHLSIVLDVKPAGGMHVYAPGVTNYRPIALALDSMPGVLVRSPQYPASEPYVFEPLNERVPVYMRPFRIVQDLVIDASPAGAAALKGRTSLTLRGTLTYQACNDTICFTPQTVPLTWSLTLRQLDRDRSSVR